MLEVYNMHEFMYSIYTHLTQKTCNVFKKNAYLAHTCPTLIWKAGGNEPRNNPCSLQPQRFKCEQTQTRFPLDIFSAKWQHSPAAKARSSPLTHSLRKHAAAQLSLNANDDDGGERLVFAPRGSGSGGSCSLRRTQEGQRALCSC